MSSFIYFSICETYSTLSLSGKGNGVLDPAGTATRAEVAQILMNFSENIAR